MTIDEMIAVLQAAKAGKVVQFQYSAADGSPRWLDLTTGLFNFAANDYRIKPEPREFIVYAHNSVLMARWAVMGREVNAGEEIRVREVIE